MLFLFLDFGHAYDQEHNILESSMKFMTLLLLSAGAEEVRGFMEDVDILLPNYRKVCEKSIHSLQLVKRSPMRRLSSSSSESQQSESPGSLHRDSRQASRSPSPSRNGQELDLVTPERAVAMHQRLLQLPPPPPSLTRGPNYIRGPNPTSGLLLTSRGSHPSSSRSPSPNSSRSPGKRSKTKQLPVEITATGQGPGKVHVYGSKKWEHYGVLPDKPFEKTWSDPSHMTWDFSARKGGHVDVVSSGRATGASLLRVEDAVATASTARPGPRIQKTDAYPSSGSMKGSVRELSNDSGDPMRRVGITASLDSRQGQGSVSMSVTNRPKVAWGQEYPSPPFASKLKLHPAHPRYEVQKND